MMAPVIKFKDNEVDNLMELYIGGKFVAGWEKPFEPKTNEHHFQSLLENVYMAGQHHERRAISDGIKALLLLK